MFALMILLAANGAVAQAAPAKPVDDNKIICKSERPVGSNLSQRVCKTRAKWTEDRDKARAGVVEDINTRAGFMKPDQPDYFSAPGQSAPAGGTGI